MNVVVSAIVDPWVTTLSFVVALAMRIQAENMLTIDRLFDFGVLGFLDTCRLSVIGVVRALNGAISDRLSDIGVLEELTRFHIQQNIRLYGAYTFFNCRRLLVWR